MLISETLSLMRDYVGTDDFWKNVTANLAVMALDPVGVGLIISHYQQRQWNKTRQSLAYIVLITGGRVMQNLDACLFIKDRRVLLSANIETHLARLELAFARSEL